MELPKGVEWAAHALVVLEVAADRAVSSVGLARVFDLSPSYLNKHLQKLAAAGIVTSTAGATGGFRLARPAADVSLGDVVAALGSATPLFQCSEIRCQGAFADQKQRILASGLCSINQAMLRAEDAWRSSLTETSIADLADGLDDNTRTRMLRATGLEPDTDKDLS
ncbi:MULTISPECIES: RrF2 family transcriptional regulator [Brevibacterium]|uniref:Rrf2 family transcriptional regulator n=1 Tax=Brevibacterium luteolum TaxID=199591 RepID=A0A6G8KXU7_9MICO|nr:MULTISPECIES: Rrf2 family transcriptional regulator [Brevibacterium]MBU8579505.1 Rrf2 family transcriptional regulator [Brevibacterium luteolum]MCT1920499.1 Rrf2 family transcriptional regulator [Brevibacterium luteolum]QIN29619.1 Rrf2 family transcriptional regulator [Brevibacterium luteolum]